MRALGISDQPVRSVFYSGGALGGAGRAISWRGRYQSNAIGPLLPFGAAVVAFSRITSISRYGQGYHQA